MVVGIEGLTLDTEIVNLFIAGLLGMLLGLEREWSNKSAGIRTFTLTSLIGAAAMSLNDGVLLALGGVLVLIQGGLLGVRGLVSQFNKSINDPELGLSLTTSTSLLLAYAVGILVGAEHVLIGAIIGITSSFLLVLRGELHGFANQLSREEVRSAGEFAIIAFVVYPLLPGGTYGPWDAIDPKLVWMLVIAVSGIGFVNYTVMQRYGSMGIAVTGFFGGLVNSTAVIGEIAGRAKNNVGITRLAVGTILIADAAMAIRNLAIIVVFVPESAISVGLPLGLIAISGVALALYDGDWEGELDVDFDSPFSSTSALKFGLLFLGVLILTAGAQRLFGTTGFLITSFLSGIVSSGTTTTTAVSLAANGQITPAVAAHGVLAGTLSSILVKIGFAASINRSLLKPVVRKSAYLSLIGIAGVIISVQLI
ncbi:MgtC/SapB family protein [Halomicroarcula sp. F13]|uniref:MgtC/SapB family protein n=1 Tax=Haloarcula rubra TaxID=2487747 RepID=A0AAW4PYT0_9EURY|nr:MgtC/SapB family protein [Halomicroarcula rubra]MBX0325650.1 MgtC/SapB family protein [Halomicroarcula rubra]